MELLHEAQQDFRAGPTVVWQFIAMRHNQHQIPQARVLAEQLGMVFSLKSVNLDMVAQDPTNVAFLPAENLLRRYETDHQQSPWKLKSERQNDCGVLWRSMMINADGVAVPCCYDYEVDLEIGRVPDQTIRDIWDGDAMQTLRRRIITERDQLPPCAKCSVDDRTIIFLDEIPVKRK